MTSLNTTFASRVREINVDIYQVLANYKRVYIHRAKTACICGELHAVQTGNALMVKDDIVTPKEDETFRHIKQLVARLKTLFHELSEENYIQTIMDKPINYVKDELSAFRKAFNKNIIANNLMKYNPCEVAENQLKIDDFSDVQDINTKLSRVLQSPNLNPDQKKILSEKLKEYQAVLAEMEKEEKEMKKKQDELRRVLSSEEITSKLQEFKKFAININDYEMQKRIGSGGFAEVYLGYQKKTGKFVAIKKLHAQTFNVKDFEMFKREVQIASSMNHFAVLAFAGVSLEPPFCILTDFMSGGCLFNRLHRGPMLDPTKLTITALGVACGMEYIHSKNMIHRDIKSLNILLDADDYPKICDFGMSRDMPDDPSLLTAGAGTSQWMAPEVLSAKPYTQKADVYSYGILLWELLTKSVPFHPLKEVQVAMAVIQGKRPLIPQNCPTALASLIKLCWDADPNKRPEFRAIKEAFLSGTIYFPGTKPERVKSYIDQSKIHQQAEQDFDPKDASDTAILLIKSDLENKDQKRAEAAFGKLKRITDYKLWEQKILSNRIIESICQLIKTCSDIQMAFDIVLVLDKMLQNPNLLNNFLEIKGSPLLLKLFIRFGTTSMDKIIDLLNLLLQKESLEFTAEHFTKFAPFLVSGKIGDRRTTTQLIISIIDRKLYDDDSSLNFLANRVLENAIPEAEPKLLESTLILLNKLLKLQQPFDVIIRADGPIVALTLARHKDVNIRKQALKLMNIMLLGSIPKPRIISVFFSGKNIRSLNDGEPHGHQTESEDIYFSKIVQTNINEPEIIIETLISIGLFLKSSSCFKEIIGQNEMQKQRVIQAFKLCFQSKDSIISLYSMKLVYAFLNNKTSFSMFSDLLIDMIYALDNNSDEVKEIAAYCLMMIIHKNQKFDLSMYPDKAKELYGKISAFLKKSLGTESSLRSASLRLCGVISTTMEGALMLKNEHITQMIADIAVSNQPGDSKLAVMVIASHSAFMPNSEEEIEIISDLFKMLDNPEMSPYQLIAISNLSINPIAASKCIGRMERLVNLLDTKDEATLNRTLTAFHRILKTPEALNKIMHVKEGHVDKFKKIILSLVEKTKQFWGNALGPISIDIIEMIAGFPNNMGVEILDNSNFKNYLIEKIEKSPLTDPLRPIYNRIASRLGIFNPVQMGYDKIFA